MPSVYLRGAYRFILTFWPLTASDTACLDDLLWIECMEISHWFLASHFNTYWRTKYEVYDYQERMRSKSYVFVTSRSQVEIIIGLLLAVLRVSVGLAINVELSNVDIIWQFPVLMCWTTWVVSMNQINRKRHMTSKRDFRKIAILLVNRLLVQINFS